MADPTTPEILTVADVDGCVALSASAGWNQTAADWHVFFRLGIVWGVREAGTGTPLASAALLPYPPGGAWISMVLTLPAARGRGYATRLMAIAIAEAERSGLVPTLDATPAGEPIYRRLGFGDGLPLARWRRPGAPPFGSAAGRGQPDPAILAADRAAFGLDRGPVLEAMSGRGPAVVTDGGFALVRDGRTAFQIGPVVAGGPGRADHPFGAALAALPAGAAVIVDIVGADNPLTAALQETGFALERLFLRMSRGQSPATDPARYLAAAGPELG